jgi:hypothetical protein
MLPVNTDQKNLLTSFKGSTSYHMSTQPVNIGATGMSNVKFVLFLNQLLHIFMPPMFLGNSGIVLANMFNWITIPSQPKDSTMIRTRKVSCSSLRSQTQI